MVLTIPYVPFLVPILSVVLTELKSNDYKHKMYRSRRMSLLFSLKCVTLHFKISDIAGSKKSASVCHHPSFFFFFLFHIDLQNKYEIWYFNFCNSTEY